jgi:hypothetical protein
MINPDYYKAANLVKGKVKNYPLKPKSVVTETIDYAVQFGDNYYSLAKKIFGFEGQHHWTIISDINPPRMPDSLLVGEIIKLPKTIIQGT